MHSILLQKWPCLVLLTGLSTTLAKPLPEDLWSDDSVASLPLDGSLDVSYDVASAPTDSIFTTDFPLPEEYPLTEDDPLLGSTPLDSGFQLAQYSTRCMEQYSAAGSVDSPSCQKSQPHAGCQVSDGVLACTFNF
jgi:hypothetical protein